MHTTVPLKVLYFGTPVVVISSLNEDGTTNIAPMSSAWWLGQDAMMGMARGSQTTENLLCDDECVLNLMPAEMVDVVDRLALTTGAAALPGYKVKQGYRFVADKFAVAGVQRQASELVSPCRILEAPIQLECKVVARHDFESSTASAVAFQARVIRTHVDQRLMLPGTAYIDPTRWDPLIMKFCDYFGGASNLQPSRLAAGWEMPQLTA